jgi:hypothetical protein
VLVYLVDGFCGSLGWAVVINGHTFKRRICANKKLGWAVVINGHTFGPLKAHLAHNTNHFITRPKCSFGVRLSRRGTRMYDVASVWAEKDSGASCFLVSRCHGPFLVPPDSRRTRV